MNLDFDYKLCQLKNYLTEDEMSSLSSKVKEFKIDLDEIKSNLGFLCWTDTVKKIAEKEDPNRYQKIIENQYITYDDFVFLSTLNEKYGLTSNNYFNFFLTYSNEVFKRVGIYDFINQAYINIIRDLFGKEIKNEYKHTLVGNINIYPKNSFIIKHQDSDPDNKRLFTILFFLNHDRKKEDGSILKIYKKDEVVDIIPNYEYCILLEHQKNNLVHEVTTNLIDNIRYSIYSPFTIKDYEEKLIHN